MSAEKKAKPAWFITGTDTGVGKTFVTCALLHALRTQGNMRAVGMKPVAAGLEADGSNDDVERLRAASSIAAPYAAINPYALSAAVAPHIAAAEAGVVIELPPILSAFKELQAMSDAVIVEGVGGFCVPLADDFDTADLAVALALPVIMVVGMRLGCINHALLTAQAIRSRGLNLAGWIANHIDPAMLRPDENLCALKDRIAAPLLGTIPYGATTQQAAELLNFPQLE